MADFVKNADRAERARRIVKAYGQEVGQPDEDLETNLGDLLADLMHLCEVDQVDFEECLDRGELNFDEEMDDERHSR